MIGKVKTWLGIEGVKIDLDLPEEFRYLDGLVTGKLYISSMSDHVVTSIHIKLIEKYSRGKKEAKLTDDTSPVGHGYTAVLQYGHGQNRQSSEVVRGSEFYFSSRGYSKGQRCRAGSLR